MTTELTQEVDAEEHPHVSWMRRIAIFVCIFITYMIKVAFAVFLGAIFGFAISDIVSSIFGFEEVLSHTIGTIVGAVGAYIKEE